MDSKEYRDAVAEMDEIWERWSELVDRSKEAQTIYNMINVAKDTVWESYCAAVEKADNLE